MKERKEERKLERRMEDITSSEMKDVSVSTDLGG